MARDLRAAIAVAMEDGLMGVWAEYPDECERALDEIMRVVLAGEREPTPASMIADLQTVIYGEPRASQHSAAEEWKQLLAIVTALVSGVRSDR